MVSEVRGLCSIRATFLFVYGITKPYTLFNVTSVNYGIVQGSILDPLMFMLYIKDIVESSSLLKFTLYADDTSVCFSGFDLNIVFNVFNRKLNVKYRRFASKTLTLNSKMSKFMIFHSRQLVNTKMDESYTEGNIEI